MTRMMTIRGTSSLLVCLLAFCLATRKSYSDYDGDGVLDSLRVGRVGFRFFSTRDTTPDERRPVGENWKAITRQALLDNDFVLDFLHRTDAEEVAVVKAAAREIVNGAATDREKVERVLAWLGAHWDFTVEHNEVNAATLLRKRQGRCETSGFFVGVLDALDIKAREVAVASRGPAPDIAVEVWLEGKWQVADLFGTRRLDRRSLLEMLPGRESEACVVYYWRDTKGKLLRSKLWYEPRVAPIFTSDRGLRADEIPDPSDLWISY